MTAVQVQVVVVALCVVTAVQVKIIIVALCVVTAVQVALCVVTGDVPEILYGHDVPWIQHDAGWC